MFETDPRERDRVSLREKPRRFQTNNHVFARNDFLSCNSDFRVGGYTTSCCAPGRQVIGQAKLDCRAPVLPSYSICFPERGVLEILAYGWLNRLTFVLEVG